jgi:hypothetical protein
MNDGYEELPSGKTIMRDFYPDGSLQRESHGYGLFDIGIEYRFIGGKKIEETYFAKGRLVSRKVYEKARVAYSDMPPADDKMEDWGADLLRGAAKEKRQHQVRGEKHIPDPAEACMRDDFCEGLMKRGKQSEVREWIKDKNHTLGEMDWPRSKRLVDKLISIGCLNVYACEIDTYGNGIENTGHLVVELPDKKAERKIILKTIDKLARDQGYEGPFDDGQRFAYVKLD